MGKTSNNERAKGGARNFRLGYVCNLDGGKCRQRNVVYRRSHCGFAVAMKVLVLSSAVSYLFLSLIGYIGYKTGVSTMEPSRIFFQFWMILFYFRD